MSLVVVLSVMMILPASGVQAQSDSSSPPAAASSDPVPAGLDVEVPQYFDPFESANRMIFHVNSVLYNRFFDPTYGAYEDYVSPEVRAGVSNVVNNLRLPISAVSSGLVLDWQNAGNSLARFALNSTVGILGLYDVATDYGYPRRELMTPTDVLCRYGVPAGPYVVLPVIGPGSMRSMAGRFGEYGLMSSAISEGPLATYIASTTFERLSEASDELDLLEATSLDAYAAVRSIYTQLDRHCEERVR